MTKKEFEKIANKLSVGQYVNYQPTSGLVSTLLSKTGTTSQQLTTDQSAKWRILNVDESTGKVMLTTDGYVNNVAIKGVTGFLNGASELNRLCEKLYSNTDKGIIARSMTIEDLDKACRHVPTINLERYAWYPGDTSDADLKDVLAGGYLYTAKKHTDSFGGGVEYPRFYNWDDKNGVTHQSTSENDYVELKSKKEPILTTRTMDWYNPSDTSTVIGDMLKGDEMNRGWLASQYVTFIANTYVGYGLRTAYTTYVYDHALFYSNGVADRHSYGLRPVVSISAKLLEVSDTSTDGASASTAWNIK